MDEVRMHHLKCKPGEIGKYVILPGDPGRVEKIAGFLDKPEFLVQNREYNIWNGYLDGELVTVCSTGIGGPSAAIAMEELIKSGADTFLRIGTCGGVSEDPLPGDLIIPTGAIRKEGTGLEYVPIEFPAVADPYMVNALAEASRERGVRHHLGVVECKDSYYGQHEPQLMPNEDELQRKWKAWKRAGAIGSEMESATLFLVASVRRVRCATILLLCRNKERDRLLKEDSGAVWDTSEAIQTGIAALKKLICRDRETKVTF